jgi:uncharacterized protein (TIGR03083 family)
MDTAGCYSAVRARMIELAATLSGQQAAAPVPALPAWTVHETYAHLAGLCTEVVEGVVAGPATDDDTARQVRDRAGRGLAEICAEWAGRAPEADALIGGPKGYRYNLLVQDAWNHEQDVLGALGLPQAREDATTPVVAAALADSFARSWRKFELRPAVRIETPTGAWTLGVDDPAATLRTSDFDLVRMLIGRRTLGEIQAMDWTGTPGVALDRLHYFAPPAVSLGE